MLQAIGQTGLQGSRLALGCMRMASLADHEAAKVLGHSCICRHQFL